MIEGALKGFALLALASITINIVKWLVHHLCVLVLLAAMLSVAVSLMR
jgi:hypothetical protein